MAAYHGPVETDYYGRPAPKGVHGSIRLEEFTSSTRLIADAITALFDQIVHPSLLVRRMYVVACNVLPNDAVPENLPMQLDMFTDYSVYQQKRLREKAALEKERRQQRAVLDIKRRFGKNAILKGMNYLEGATARDRNAQIGGHKA